MPLKPRITEDDEPTAPVPTNPAVSLDSHLEFAKWLAIITMVVDHVAYLFAPTFNLDYVTWRSIGRLCWPLMAWIVALRLYVAPTRTIGYLKRLAPWAVIAQIPYIGVFLEQSGKDWWEGFNIFFTIGFGCLIFLLVEMWDSASNARKAGIVAAIIAIVCASVRVDYGPIGVMSIPVMALLARRNVMQTAIACGLLAGAANVSSLLTDHVFVQYWPMCLGALVAIPVAMACLKYELPLPRLPRWFFYLFYPLHLLVLFMVYLAITVHTVPPSP